MGRRAMSLYYIDEVESGIEDVEYARSWVRGGCQAPGLFDGIPSGKYNEASGAKHHAAGAKHRYPRLRLVEKKPVEVKKPPVIESKPFHADSLEAPAYVSERLKREQEAIDARNKAVIAARENAILEARQSVVNLIEEQNAIHLRDAKWALKLLQSYSGEDVISAFGGPGIRPLRNGNPGFLETFQRMSWAAGFPTAEVVEVWNCGIDYVVSQVPGSYSSVRTHRGLKALHWS